MSRSLKRSAAIRSVLEHARIEFGRKSPDDVRAPIRRGRASQRGQSLTEFAFVVPILLLLLVAVGDFGRIFAAGIILEAAARDAAEVAANEYLATPPGPVNAPAPPAVPAYYSNIRDKAAKTACAEVQELANTQYDPATKNCPGMPLILVCVHDGQDPGCASEAHGATIPAQCEELTNPPTNASALGTSRYVEVRLCYRFDSVVDSTLISFGTFWLQRSRTFVIPCYFVLGSDECA